MSQWLCKAKAFDRKRAPVGEKERKFIYKEMTALAKKWQNGEGYANARDLNFNNFANFDSW